MNYCHYYSLNSFLCSTPHFSLTKYPFHHHHHHLSSTVSCSLRRHLRRRKIPKNPNQRKPSDEKLQIAIDFQPFSNKASSLPIRKLLNSSQLRFNEFVQTGNEALEDLMTTITVDANWRVIISCRPSTVRFGGNLVLFGFVILVAFRVLVKLGLGFWGKMRFGNGSGVVVRRRDRSLGGREVVVATTRRHNTRDGEFRILENPLAPVLGSGLKSVEEMRKSGVRRMGEEELPSWWSVSLPPPVLIDEKEEYQRMANRLIRGFVC